MSLQTATQKDNMELIYILLEAGADVNGCPGNEYLPWLSSNIVGYIVSCDISITRTPLQEAVNQDNAATVRLLLRFGADINSAGGFATALQTAVTIPGAHHMVRLLLRKGADVNGPALGARSDNSTPGGR